MTEEATTSLEGLRIGDADDAAPAAEEPKPTVILVIGETRPQDHSVRAARPRRGGGAQRLHASVPHAGMAGSGKTTFMQRLNSHLHTQKRPGYIVNLDPAVTHVPYSPNIDIRDTVRRRAPRGGRAVLCSRLRGAPVCLTASFSPLPSASRSTTRT